MRTWLIVSGSILIVSCSNNQSFLFLKTNKHDLSGYINDKGDTVIPFGKYNKCFTDTFRKFAIVEIAESGFIVINRKEKSIANVFLFDNGPDYLSD